MTGLWNRGLVSNLRYFRYNDISVRYPEFTPYNRPGCAAIAYFKGLVPSWIVVPCNDRLSIEWICKRPKVSHLQHSTPRVPLKVCCRRCVFVSGSCLSFRKRLYPDRNLSHIHMPYLSYFSRILLQYYFDGPAYNDSIFQQKVYRENSKWQVLVSHGIYYSTQFTFENTTARHPDCGPNMQRCGAGYCRADDLICISDFECRPDLCACTVGGSLVYDAEYCSRICHPGACGCAPLMFQCSTGGCVPYMFICDGTPHCVDSSDEFYDNGYHRLRERQNAWYDFSYSTVQTQQYCLGFICPTGECINIKLVNDLIQDCSSPTDEQHSINIKHGEVYHCKDIDEIPCVPNHSKCFRIQSLCVYDLDILGHIVPCRDGAHLFNCNYIQCTNTFKCPGSYCIPLRKVCDGVKDCLGGEDEYNCHLYTCPGYLKCSGVLYCVHPLEVCDEIQHCPNGDDEVLCDINSCPVGCECLGYSALCRNNAQNFIPKFVTKMLKYLSVGHETMYRPKFDNLTLVSRLLTLDMSNSAIVDICTAFQIPFNFYASLYILDLTRNSINHLSNRCFHKLISLRFLHLKDNALAHITDGTFQRSPLYFLSIANMGMQLHSDVWILDLGELRILDITGVRLSNVNHLSHTLLRSVPVVYTDDIRLCCMFYNVQNCHTHISANFCKRLLLHKIVGIFLLLWGISSFSYSGMTMWINVKLFYRIKPVKFLLLTTVLFCAIISTFHMIAIASVDVIMGNSYIMIHQSWAKSNLCKMLSTFLSISISASSTSISLLNHITYKVVTAVKVVEKEYNKRIIITFLFFIAIIFACFLAPSILTTQVRAGSFCTVIFEEETTRGFEVFPSLLLSAIMIVALIHTIHTSFSMWMYVYSSGSDIRVSSSSRDDHWHERLWAFSKILLLAIVLRMLECLPIPCLVLLAIMGRSTHQELHLTLIIMSLSISCLYYPYLFVWREFRAKRHR